MRRSQARAALALAVLLASCQRPPPAIPKPGLAQIVPSPEACHVGPDGAPVDAQTLADRGIGGTGGPILTADRGIGGTGSPTLMADRGIGGTGIDKSDLANTGIVGVITGFASVCLAGQEVALPPDVRVAIDSQPASPDSLRAGQVAVVEASGNPASLSARRILIRYEVVGPVERLDGDMLRIAGQQVALSPQTWGIRPGLGEWVAVSGLRRGNGTIEATRVERRQPGQILVHGPLTEENGDLRIGDLSIRRDPATVALTGQVVTITGVTGNGVAGQTGELLPFSIMPDLLAVDPAAFFGPRVGVVLIEGFAVIDGGRLRFAPGFSAPAPGLRLDGPRHGVFRLERVNGGLRAVGLGAAPSGVAAPSRSPALRFEPAPVPNRAIRGPAARGGDPRRGGADGQRGRFNRNRGDMPGDPNASPTPQGPFPPIGSDRDGPMRGH